jgi:hypothetical protein
MANGRRTRVGRETRAAFRRARDAFGGGSDVAELLVRVERCGTLGCPRVLVAAALHAFLSADDAGRRDAIVRYFAWMAQPAAEAMSLAEEAALVELEQRTYGGAVRRPPRPPRE